METGIMPDARVPRDEEARLVFVYGTLRRGGSNDINRFVPPPVFVGGACVHGHLYDLGAYPGLLLTGGEDSGRSAVVGEVYAVHARLEPQLDALEGIHGRSDDEYVRRHIPVELGGRSCLCLVYEINPEYVRGRPLIDHGDWIQHAAERPA